MTNANEHPLSAQVRQATAWLSFTRPEEWPRWDEALLGAFLSDDFAGSAALERRLVEEWLRHRDNPPVEMAAVREQGVAWLGEQLGQSWLHAHTLAINSEELDRDLEQMFGLWRLHRDDAIVPDEARVQVGDLARQREARFVVAKDWFRRHDPAYLSRWQTSNAFADTAVSGWDDERALVKGYLAGLTAVAAMRGGVAPAGMNTTPRRPSGVRPSKASEWAERSGRPNRHETHPGRTL